MKRLAIVLLVAVLLLGTLTACKKDGVTKNPVPTTTAAPIIQTTTTTAAPQRPVMYVTATKLNVRNGPGTENDIVGMLLYGTMVEVISNEGGWYMISYAGIPAYVSAQYLSPVAPAPLTTTTTTTTVTGDALPTGTDTTAVGTGTTASGKYPNAAVPPLQGGLTSDERVKLYEGLQKIISENGSHYKDVYNYVHDNKTYRSMNEGKSIEEMAYTAMKNKSVSCYYFAAFTYLLMKQAGYEVEFVRGLGWQNGTEHCWIMFKEMDGWYFMDSLYVRSAKLTTAECQKIGYKWNPEVHPKTV